MCGLGPVHAGEKGVRGGAGQLVLVHRRALRGGSWLGRAASSDLVPSLFSYLFLFSIFIFSIYLLLILFKIHCVNYLKFHFHFHFYFFANYICNPYVDMYKICLSRPCSSSLIKIQLPKKFLETGHK